MNQSQIKYIRECLTKRKNDLIDKLCKTEPKPQEVVDAQAVVDAWNKASSATYNEIRRNINNKIRSLEEQLILGGEFKDIHTALQDLDTWQP